MVNPDILYSRLEKLKEYITILKSLQDYPESEFINTPLLHGGGERYVQLSVECMLDIGKHIIADSRYRSPQDYKDVFQVLLEENIISIKLCERLKKWAGLRNIIVHDYMKLDTKKIYDVICHDLTDIKQYIKKVADFI